MQMCIRDRGYSLKTVALLDKGNIQGLVVPDGYEIGYKSVDVYKRQAYLISDCTGG